MSISRKNVDVGLSSVEAEGAKEALEIKCI